jgi:hypothetical protein
MPRLGHALTRPEWGRRTDGKCGMPVPALIISSKFAVGQVMGMRAWLKLHPMPGNSEP